MAIQQIRKMNTVLIGCVTNTKCLHTLTFRLWIEQSPLEVRRSLQSLLAMTAGREQLNIQKKDGKLKRKHWKRNGFSKVSLPHPVYSGHPNPRFIRCSTSIAYAIVSNSVGLNELDNGKVGHPAANRLCTVFLPQ